MARPLGTTKSTRRPEAVVERRANSAAKKGKGGKGKGKGKGKGGGRGGGKKHTQWTRKKHHCTICENIPGKHEGVIKSHGAGACVEKGGGL